MTATLGRIPNRIKRLTGAVGARRDKSGIERAREERYPGIVKRSGKVATSMTGWCASARPVRW